MSLEGYTFKHSDFSKDSYMYTCIGDKSKKMLKHRLLANYK